jgi:hypothetical protein
MMAQVALERGLFFLVKTQGMVGTGFKAQLAADALLIIEDHDAVLPLGYGLGRTHGQAGGVVTVAAYVDLVGEVKSVFNHARAVLGHVEEFDFEIMFLLAGHFTGSAAPAGFIIYYQRIWVHEARLLYI